MTEGAKQKIAVRDLDGSPSFAADAIGPGKQVTLQFALVLADGRNSGDVVDGNFDKSPVSFVVGDGNLLPGFEEALFGLVAGDRRDLVIKPEQAFGAVNEDNIQRFPLYQFAPDLALAPGLMIEFVDAAGTNQAGVVNRIDKQWVEVDFNHPLAGRTLRFSVHIHDVRLHDQHAHDKNQVQQP